MSPSTVEVTSVRVMLRAASMLAMPAVRQAARPCRTYSAGVGPLSRSTRTAGVVGVQHGGPVVCHLLPGAVEAVDGRAVVGAAHPPVGGAETERRELGVGLDGVERGEEGGGVDAVADGGLGKGSVTTCS